MIELREAFNADIKADTKTSLQLLKAELLEKIKASRVESAERFEKVESTLLTEFHKWTVPIESRIGSTEVTSSSLMERVRMMEQRIRELDVCTGGRSI